MIIVREEQIEIFDEAVANEFENHMVRHVEEFTPPHFQVIGEEGAREVVRLGIKQAEKYNLNTRGPIQFYIESMFMIGSYFDTDPQYPWAGEILNDPTIEDQMERADYLYEEMQKYVQSVAGPNKIYAHNALKALSNFRSQSTPRRGPDFEEEMIQHLKHIYPEKCAFVGHPALRGLIASGIDYANDYWPGNDHGTGLLIGLMFALGHGVAVDPQFPWVSATLNNSLISDSEKRIERLKSKSFTYLDHVLKYLGRG